MQPVWKDPSTAGKRRYESRLIRPNPPTPEMVQRAQPFRADTIQEFEAVIKYPANPLDV